MDDLKQIDFQNLVNSTFVFGRKPNGFLHSLLTKEEIPNSDTWTAADSTELHNYYRMEIEKLQQENKLPAKGTYETSVWRERYREKVVQLINQTKIKEGDTIYFLTPFDDDQLEQSETETFLKDVAHIVDSSIDGHIASQTHVPELLPEETWKQRVATKKSEFERLNNTLRLQYEYHDPKSESPESTEHEIDVNNTEPKTVVPSNLVVGFGNQNLSKTHPVTKWQSQSSTILRQLAVPKIFDVDKLSYILFFRNYVRMLRRLFNFTLIQEGLFEEVTYLKFYEGENEGQAEFSINQPFYKDESHDDQRKIHGRIGWYMGMRQFRMHPFTKKNRLPKTD